MKRGMVFQIVLDIKDFKMLNNSKTIEKQNSKDCDNNLKKENISKYEIIRKLYSALLSEFESLKDILLDDLSITDKAKEKAAKISKITLGLQSCLDHEKGEETSENLMWCYRYIRYAVKRVEDNDDMDFVQPAYKVILDLNEAWNGIPKNLRT